MINAAYLNGLKMITFLYYYGRMAGAIRYRKLAPTGLLSLPRFALFGMHLFAIDCYGVLFFVRIRI